MSDFKADLRLPIDVLRKAPFVYVGPDYRSLPMGVISDTMMHHGKQIQRLYPFTISEVQENNIIVDQLFCFSFIYVNDKDELVIFLTQPIPLTNLEGLEAFETLLAESERLAKFSGGSLIEIELHDQTAGTVAFPTSLSFLSYHIDHLKFKNPGISYFKKHGFREEKELCCFDHSISGFEHKAKKGKRDRYIVCSASPLEFIATKEEALNFPVRSAELTHVDGVFGSTRIPFFEDTGYTVHRRSRLSLWKRSMEGYMRWSPNIMENRTALPLLFPDDLEGRAYNYGKIFDWGLRKKDRDLLSSLLSRAVKAMKQRGIERFQFANVDVRNRFIVGLLEEFSFKISHKTKLLRKRIG